MMATAGVGKESIARQRLRETAYHEAGHAAASYFLELDFVGVDVVFNPDENRFGQMEAAPWRIPPYPKEQATLDALEHRVITCFAGMAAEVRYTGRLRWKYGSADFNDAFNLALARHSGGSMEEVGAFLSYVWVRTNEFVRHPHHWAAISGLAQALIRQERIEKTAAIRIMNDAVAPLLREHGFPRSEAEQVRRADDKHRQLWQWAIRSRLRKRQGF